eukprot:COSAG06_NODE_26106_length_621_cov_1.308429_1_plen_96_part_00
MLVGGLDGYQELREVRMEAREEGALHVPFDEHVGLLASCGVIVEEGRVSSSSRRRRHASSRSSDKRARDDGPNNDLRTAGPRGRGICIVYMRTTD